jgi:hypothetical protein
MLFILFQLNASAFIWNYMNKGRRISWEGHDVGSAVGGILLPLSVTVQCL